MRKALISQGFSVRHLNRPQHLVGDGGFDLQFLPDGKKLEESTSVCTGRSDMPPAYRLEMGSKPYPSKKETHQKVCLFSGKLG
jgi:hypothetical protein